MNSLSWQIRQALRQELEETAAFHEFAIHSAERQGSLWRIFIDPFASSGAIDESLESSGAWWRDDITGAAEVLASDPDSDLIILRNATSNPPFRGGTLRVYPPRFLSALEKVWHDESWTDECEAWLQNSAQGNASSPPLRNKHFDHIRSSQAGAFALPGRKAGFLWGPPGAGKTTTLAAMLATYLLAHPDKRALLFSTTNSAVDIALTRVDQALQSIGKTAAAMRRRCARLGNHFLAATYLEREHLIPRGDKNLIADLARLEGTKPDPHNSSAYAQWRQEIDFTRSQLTIQAHEALGNASLVAMTVTHAIYILETLRERAPFDLIVFDEASQISIPYALALAPLSDSAIFAGDPEQLSPIVRSRKTEARDWMAHSMFKWIDRFPGATAFLDEQSRMAPPICELVSREFYQGKLKVASDATTNPDWLRDRACAEAPRRYRGPIIIHEVFKDGGHSQKYRGRIRQQSAYFAVQLILQLLIHTRSEEILVLTPFRAQRNLLKNFLRIEGLPNIRVSTVHRAQGSECHTVIFDPVEASSDFLQGESGRRLLNVAFSRAQARLILLLSANDRRHPVFQNLP